MPPVRTSLHRHARLAGLVLSVLLLAMTPGGSTALPDRAPSAATPETAAAQRVDARSISTQKLTTAAAARTRSDARPSSKGPRLDTPRRGGSLTGLPLADTLIAALAAGRAVQETADALERQLAPDPRAQRELRRLAQVRAEAVLAAKARAEARAQAEAAARAKAEAEARARREAARYQGQNHFWYPALGIDHSVAWFPCSRSRPPDSLLYRWGCAGSGNVYLLAHAWSWFAPLNRAYYAGTLEPGQLVAYADPDGRTRFYRLAWWKVWQPLPSASWAWASQSRSSLTLQTCVGANSELRLFVRYHEVASP